MVPVTVENPQVHPVEEPEMETAQAPCDSAAGVPAVFVPLHIAWRHQHETLGSVRVGSYEGGGALLIYRLCVPDCVGNL